MTDVPALCILAMDQRDSIEQQVYGLDEAPTPDQAASIAAAKLLTFRGLLDALPSLPDDARAGFLVDEQYGASAAVIAAADDRVRLAMPIEASGREWFEFAYGAEWRHHATFFRPRHVKVLIRDNPAFDPGMRAVQAARLAEVSAWASAGTHRFLLELLVPATDDDLAGVGGDADRYDREVRPELTVQTIRYLQDRGVEPEVWKIEGLDDRADAERIAAAARRDGREATCIVLGRHAPKERLDGWLRVAASVEGFEGFAIGRSIWWDPLKDLLAGQTDEDTARRRISEAYAGYVHTYLEARAA